MLALLSPISIGDELLAGVRLEDASTELGLRLLLDVGGERLWVDVGPIDHVRRYAARSALLGFGYRTEGGRNDIDPKLGLRICEVLASAVQANEYDVLERLSAEAQAEGDADKKIYRAKVPRALEPSGIHELRYYTINPYVGFVIGCRFCYAQSPLAAMRAMMGLTEARRGSYVEVRENLAEVLATELTHMAPLPIKFCPIVGDAYQAVERNEEITRKCLQAIADATTPERIWPAMILTRSTLMMRDVDLLASLPQAWAGVSLPTVDDEVRAHFEPRASSVPERLELLSTLRSAGVSTIAVVQPMMAGSVEKLADALAQHADAVVLDVLQEEEAADEDFNDARFSETRTEDWQRDHAMALLALLEERGVRVWRHELPPEYC